MDRTARYVSWFSAAALVVSAVWYGLAVSDVTTAPLPPDDPSLPLDVRVDNYLTWFRGTLTQEYLYGTIAIVGFVGTIVLFQLIRIRTSLGVLASALGTLGATLWIVGNVLQLGGHRAVEVLSEGRTDLLTANAVLVSVDTIDDRFELVAFAALGVALLSFAAAGERSGKGWKIISIAVGAVLIATALAYAAELDDVTDILLLLGGVIGFPAWLVMTGRDLSEPSPASDLE